MIKKVKKVLHLVLVVVFLLGNVVFLGLPFAMEEVRFTKSTAAHLT